MLHIGIMYLISMAESLKMGSKNVSNREGNQFFKLFLCWLGRWKYNRWGVQIFYICNLFNSKQPTITHQCEMTACWSGNIHECKAHLYQHSLFLSEIAGLKPGRLKCLHSVSGAQADHPLGPLIFFTDTDKLTVKHTRWARLIQHACLLLSAPRQPWLHDSSGTFGSWRHLRDKIWNERPDGVWISEAYEP